MAARPALTAQGRVRRVRFGSEWGADLEDNRLSSLCRPTGTHAPSSTNSQRPSMIVRSDLTDEVASTFAVMGRGDAGGSLRQHG